MTLDEILELYKRRTPNSQAAFNRALKTVAGGISANVKYFDPYPLFMKNGEGAWLTDVDDNRYVDYVLSYGPLELGHGRPEIIEAIATHFKEHGTTLYGTPGEIEAAFGERIKSYYPSMELLRYTNSGTEATLFSLRLARAWTNKYKICKFEGHYHGGYNEVLISVNPNLEKAGDIRHPVSLPESAGLPPFQTEDTIVLPFNDLPACREILTARQEEVSAVIMEPVLGGYIPATPEFMKGIRALTEELGILMIMDEVKTGFRIGLGGAQGYYGVRPDITAMGKVIGAGFPVGIVGGRKEIMELAAPLSGSDVFDISDSRKSSSADVLFHSGTYNGHALILSLGLKTMDILDNEFNSILVHTEQLKDMFTKIYAKHGIKILTPGIGTMFNIAVTDLDQITNYRNMQKSNFELRKRVDYSMLLEGVYNKPGNRYNLSTAHTDSVIDFTAEACEKAFARI